MKTPLYFDLKQHLLEWYRYVLPLFVVVGAVVMVLFIALRTGSRGPKLPGEGFVPARVGLLAPGKEARFDAAFAVLSPIEMVLAPTAATFDAQVGSPHGSLADASGAPPATGRSGENVYAIADGMVIRSGEGLLILHERTDGSMLKSFYGNLDSVPVAVGAQVRRGEVIGATSGPEGLHFELQQSPSLEIGTIPADSDLKPPAEWRGRGADRLSAPPAGEALEPSPLILETLDKQG